MASSTASGAAVTPSLTPLPPDDLLIIGVDIGTGSSRVNAKHVHGIFTRESAKIRVVRLKADQDVATKQILILHKDGNVVYGNHDVNKAMQQDRKLKAKTMRRIKLALHPEFSRLDGVVHTLATIYAEKDWAALQDLFEDFLRAVLNDVRTAFKRPDLRSGKPDSYWDAIPLEIHISVPAMWNDGQRGTVRNAAQRAAMAFGRSRKDPMIDLCEEALCVAIYFLSKNLAVEVGSLHIFVDVGDGTLDITTVVVTRAHSSSAPMQIQRVGLCSGSGAGAHMINAEAEAFIIKKYGEAYVDRKCRQLDICRHEFSRQLWKEIDKLKRDMNESSIGDLHYIRISGNHGRMEPGLLNHWPIPLTDEEMAQCVDRWTTRTDQLLQEHLAALSAEHEMTNISAILTGGGSHSAKFVERMRARFAQYGIDCTAAPDAMACAEGTLMQHYFPEDTLPDRANFYVAVKVHSDDASEEEPELNEYEPPEEESDEDGDSDEDEGIFMGATIVESEAKSSRKRPRPEDEKGTYLPDRTKMVGSWSNGRFTSMEPVPLVFQVDADKEHLGRVHADLFWSKLRFAEHTPLKDDAGNLIPGVREYPKTFADLEDLEGMGFEVHDGDANSPPHFQVKAFVEMAGSSEKLSLTLHVMKPDYEFPHELDGSASTINVEDRLFEHTQEVWSKGCSHFTSNTTGTSSSSGDDSAEAVEPTREVRKRQCKR